MSKQPPPARIASAVAPPAPNASAVGHGPTALAEGVVGLKPYCACSRCGWGCLDIFLSSIISLFFLPLSGRLPDVD